MTLTYLDSFATEKSNLQMEAQATRLAPILAKEFYTAGKFSNILYHYVNIERMPLEFLAESMKNNSPEFEEKDYDKCLKFITSYKLLGNKKQKSKEELILLHKYKVFFDKMREYVVNSYAASLGAFKIEEIFPYIKNKTIITLVTEDLDDKDKKKEHPYIEMLAEMYDLNNDYLLLDESLERDVPFMSIDNKQHFPERARKAQMLAAHLLEFPFPSALSFSQIDNARNSLLKDIEPLTAAICQLSAELRSIEFQKDKFEQIKSEFNTLVAPLLTETQTTLDSNMYMMQAKNSLDPGYKVKLGLAIMPFSRVLKHYIELGVMRPLIEENILHRLKQNSHNPEKTYIVLYMILLNNDKVINNENRFC